MPRNKRLHFKDLDALKFIMLLPVLLHCSMLSIQPQGEGITVQIAKASQYFVLNSADFFFFLSSFLLASHALREIKYRENFALKKFFMRRILRMGVYFIIIFAFIFFFHPWVAKTLKLFEFNTPSLTPFLTGIPNYTGDLNGTQDSILIVIWGLYMFLQYYFVIGIIFKYLINKIVWIGLIFIIGGIIFRYALIFGNGDLLFNTLSYLVPIGFGLILAKIIREENSIVEKIKGLSKAKIAIVYVIVILHITAAYLFSPKYLYPLIPVLSGLLFSFIVMEQTYSKKSLIKLRKNEMLSRLGKISLGMLVFYGMFSIVSYIAVESVNLDLTNAFVKILMVVGTFIISWLFGDICYNLIERPLRNIKREFKRE